MRQQTRSAIANGLDRTHLLRPAARLRETWLTRHAQERLISRDDGLPILPRMAGRNLCTVYHPAPYVSGSLLVGFDDVHPFNLGSLQVPILQDAYIARRPVGG